MLFYATLRKPAKCNDACRLRKEDLKFEGGNSDDRPLFGLLTTTSTDPPASPSISMATAT